MKNLVGATMWQHHMYDRLKMMWRRSA